MQLEAARRSQIRSRAPSWVSPFFVGEVVDDRHRSVPPWALFASVIVCLLGELVVYQHFRSHHAISSVPAVVSRLPSRPPSRPALASWCRAVAGRLFGALSVAGIRWGLF